MSDERDKRPLSERLTESVELHREYVAVACERGDANLTDDELEVVSNLEHVASEAASIVAAFDGAGPEVETLLERAEWLLREDLDPRDNRQQWAEDLRSYAAALVRAQRAEARVEKAGALIALWRQTPDGPCGSQEAAAEETSWGCALQLEAALADEMKGKIQ